MSADTPPAGRTSTSLKAFTWPTSPQAGVGLARSATGRRAALREPGNGSTRQGSLPTSVSEDAATCSLQPSPAEVPGGGSKGLRGWKGAPVPFWVARFSRRLTSTGPSRVHFPRTGPCRLGLPSVYVPGGRVFSPPALSSTRCRPLGSRDPWRPFGGRASPAPLPSWAGSGRGQWSVLSAPVPDLPWSRRSRHQAAPSGSQGGPPRPGRESGVCVWWRGEGEARVEGRRSPPVSLA